MRRSILPDRPPARSEASGDLTMVIDEKMSELNAPSGVERQWPAGRVHGRAQRQRRPTVGQSGELERRRFAVSPSQGNFLLATTPGAAHAGWLYYAGVALALGVTVYEERLIALAKDVFALNDRVFLTNMAFSVGFLGTTLASYVAR